MMIKRLEGLLSRLGGKPAGGRRSFALDADLYAALLEQAESQQVPAQALYNDLLAEGLAKRQKYEELWQQWESLSPRERDVIAFVCLKYTNRQIAVQMQLSSQTVNWYVRKILEKSNLHSKFEIQDRFKGWDFSKWGPKGSP